MKNYLFLLLLFAAFCSCSKDDGTEAPPPESLAYSKYNVFLINIPIAELLPTVSGGTVAKYSISPELPAGLFLNPTTGVISGTPTAFFPDTTFILTAHNSGGSTSFELTIKVNDVAMPSFSYPSGSGNLYVNSAVNIEPISTGGPVTSYTVNPSLPAGLSLNPTTGVISGTPTAAMPVTSYTITGYNSAGGLSIPVGIRVNEVVPGNIVYAASNVYVKNYSVVYLSPYRSAQTAVSFSISPALPLGLSINATTGLISGTPLVDAATTTYTVTATNSFGSSTCNFDITVNNQLSRVISEVTSATGSGLYYSYAYDMVQRVSDRYCQGRGCSGTYWTFYYSNVKITSYSATDFNYYTGDGPPTYYYLTYTGNDVTSVYYPPNTANYTYDSSGRLTDKQVGSVHYTYEYYPDGNLYKYTDSSNSSNNKVYHSYDTKNNPLRLGGFTAEYLKLFLVPLNNPTAMNDETYVYEYNIYNYPDKKRTYRNGVLVGISDYNYE